MATTLSVTISGAKIQWAAVWEVDKMWKRWGEGRAAQNVLSLV